MLLFMMLTSSPKMPRFESKLHFLSSYLLLGTLGKQEMTATVLGTLPPIQKAWMEFQPPWLQPCLTGIWGIYTWIDGSVCLSLARSLTHIPSPCSPRSSPSKNFSCACILKFVINNYCFHFLFHKLYEITSL